MYGKAVRKEDSNMRLYEIACKTQEESLSPEVKVKKISPFALVLEGEKPGMKTLLGRLLFYMLSKGNFRIYYVTEDTSGIPIHTSYVMGRSFKFPFMEKNTLHIGPCYTAPTHRGRGIYRKVLGAIVKSNGKDYSKAYMMVAEDNLPSVKGIEAAGFCPVGTVERSRFLKIYRRTDHV